MLQHAFPKTPNELRFQDLCRWRFPCQEWRHSVPPSWKIPRRSPNCIPDITLLVLDLLPLCYSFPRSTEASITQHAHHTPASLYVSVAGKVPEAICDPWCIFASWPSLKGRFVISVQSLSVGSFTPALWIQDTSRLWHQLEEPGRAPLSKSRLTTSFAWALSSLALRSCLSQHHGFLWWLWFPSCLYVFPYLHLPLWYQLYQASLFHSNHIWGHSLYHSQASLIREILCCTVTLRTKC